MSISKKLVLSKRFSFYKTCVCILQVTPVSTGASQMLSTLIEMIREEFAFDGYLDDGIEDLNMGKA